MLQGRAVGSLYTEGRSSPPAAYRHSCPLSRVVGVSRAYF